jgi:hypothetical protein
MPGYLNSWGKSQWLPDKLILLNKEAALQVEAASLFIANSNGCFQSSNHLLWNHLPPLLVQAIGIPPMHQVSTIGCTSSTIDE